MLKEISVGQTRVGMHVHAFSGSWIDHPFWRARFTVASDEDLRRILDSGVRALWIDTDKGRDVDVAPEKPVHVAVASQPEDASPPALPQADLPRGLCEAELAEAARLCRTAAPRIAAMFGEVRMGKAVDRDLCETLVDEITDSVSRNPTALVSVARLKRQDDYTFMHSLAVCGLMVSLGKQLGLRGRELMNAGLGGLLHDVGKAQVPLEILNKPGKLSTDEFGVMQQHPRLGEALLRSVGGVDAAVVDVCLHHHEKLDGTGYLQRAGEQISLFARMGAVCDVYDALTSNRPYKVGWNPAEALRRMAQWQGHFEQRVLHALVALIGLYPVGSLVRLQSGRIAVVVAHEDSSLLTPKVKAFFDTRKNLRIEPVIVDLARPGCQDAIERYESAGEWNFKDVDALWCPAIV